MPQIGDVYRLPDRLTGFSNDPDKERWCVVVVADRYSVRVAPRSATSEDGVYVPKEAMACFSKDGHFYDDWKSVSLASLRDYESAGQLENPHRDAVVKQYTDSQQARRDRRGRGR